MKIVVRNQSLGSNTKSAVKAVAKKGSIKELPSMLQINFTNTFESNERMAETNVPMRYGI